LTVYQIDPIDDPRWERLSLEHPAASVFHSPAWLKALRRAYQYEPVVLTTSPPEKKLANGFVFCRIKSRLTGNRLVSLPFSDHCEPLVDNPIELECLLSVLKGEFRKNRWKYIEIRPVTPRFVNQAGFSEAEGFWLHRVDLRRPADALFRSFHTNVKRNVRRAEGKSLRYEDGRSDTLLKDFYSLMTLTRRRHFLPPQPLYWFRALLDCMGEKADISLVYKDNKPMASIFALRHKDVLVYKYGCFDYDYRQFAGMTLVLWRAIQKAREQGVLEFDLGRSDLEDLGLITFKDRWASQRSRLTYWRLGTSRFNGAPAHWATRFGGRILARLPDTFLTSVGRLLYKHVG
jgi:hypothetical protein